jgi:hypothetical protein
MSLYNGAEFNRSLLQFKHSIPFILSNYIFYPPGNTRTKNDKIMQPLYDRSHESNELVSRHALQDLKLS